MAISRREFLRAAGIAGGLVAVQHPLRALAGPLHAPGATGAARTSALLPGMRLVHGDMHNHSHLSDGNGDHFRFYGSARDHGLDVAALTDHSTVSWSQGEHVDLCGEALWHPPDEGERHQCRNLGGLTHEGWEIAGSLADQYQVNESFVALRGFEWSSPTLGHINVWFSRTWIDPLSTGGLSQEGIGAFSHQAPVLGPPVFQPVGDAATRPSPARGTNMIPFYEWLLADPDTPGIGGGADGIAGFNHPGREPGRFGFFRAYPRVASRFVTLEILNRREDYLFKDYGARQPSPLCECLNEGWWVGLIGVTDEHGINWGRYDRKGRAGLWLRDELGLTRAGVREALEERRVFATREEGLRLAATANGVPMGRGFVHPGGPVQFAVDLEWTAGTAGTPIEIQVLGRDDEFPRVVHIEPATLPGPGDGPIEFTANVPGMDGDWLVVRVADPLVTNAHPGPPAHRASQTHALAYSSPFWPIPPGVAS